MPTADYAKYTKAKQQTYDASHNTTHYRPSWAYTTITSAAKSTTQANSTIPSIPTPCPTPSPSTDLPDTSEYADYWTDFTVNLIGQLISLGHMNPYEYIVNETIAGNLDQYYNFADFYKADGGYHTQVDCWQEIGGFNDLYDVVFDVATSMDKEKFPFTTPDGEEYIIWLWKGDYINLGAGTEMALYHNPICVFDKPIQWESASEYCMPMTVNLDINDGEYVNKWSPSDPQWWITDFLPEYQDVQASDITASGTITFTSDNPDNVALYEDMYYAFKESLNHKSIWTFDDDTLTASYIW